MSNLIVEGINYISWFLELIGVAIITYGGIKAVAYLVHKECKKDKHPTKREKEIKLRHDFGLSLVLALEFLLAADIIRTVLSPTYDELGKLAILMVIRTTLSFFLTKEIKDN